MKLGGCRAFLPRLVRFSEPKAHHALFRSKNTPTFNSIIPIGDFPLCGPALGEGPSGPRAKVLHNEGVQENAAKWYFTVAQLRNDITIEFHD